MALLQIASLKLKLCLHFLNLSNVNMSNISQQTCFDENKPNQNL